MVKDYYAALGAKRLNEESEAFKKFAETSKTELSKQSP
jgi:hypothetical protein